LAPWPAGSRVTLSVPCSSDYSDKAFHDAQSVSPPIISAVLDFIVVTVPAVHRACRSPCREGGTRRPHHVSHSVRLAFPMMPITEPGVLGCVHPPARSSSSSSIASHRLPFSHPLTRACGQSPVLEFDEQLDDDTFFSGAFITLPSLETHAALGSHNHRA